MTLYDFFHLELPSKATRKRIPWTCHGATQGQRLWTFALNASKRVDIECHVMVRNGQDMRYLPKYDYRILFILLMHMKSLSKSFQVISGSRVPFSISFTVHSGKKASVPGPLPSLCCLGGHSP